MHIQVVRSKLGAALKYEELALLDRFVANKMTLLLVISKFCKILVHFILWHVDVV